ncbi:MAG: hypothetical protein HYR51_01140 [Candidatus Rokubacteria bacterium]|nr:hypothetical protein [Candidatus Rokubacteria bacterium]
MPRAVKPVVLEDGPPSNAWAAGVRTLVCLWCERAFPSAGRHERMCPACRRRTP